MSKIFLGKFNKKYPDQIERKYFLGGPKGSTWYGDVEVGDYVFVNYAGNIVALWKASEFTKMDNPINNRDKDVLKFKEIKTYENVNTTNDFTRYKHFIHNLDLVNKSTKSTKSLSFIPIETTENCPNPEDIDFKNNEINIYIALDDINLKYRDGDIRVKINNINEMRIVGIERYINNSFSTYDVLNNLYEERNKDDGKYTIRELKEYAIEDNATFKKKFLITVIKELEEKGYFKVSSPVKLYDNLLVGRKRTSSPKQHSSEELASNDGEDIQLEDNPLYEDYANLLNFNANMILYGPPGTGKTFATDRIIDLFEKKHFRANSSYTLAQKEKRVKYVTFHQSYSYEEFIEGIRPILDENESKLGYNLENGIFKELCINAGKELIKKQDNALYIDMINSDSQVWKISLGERSDNTVYNDCIKNNQIAIHYQNTDFSEMEYDDILNSLNKSEYGENPTQNANSIDSFVNKMTRGDIVMVYDSRQTIRMIGVIDGDYIYMDDKDKYPHRRSVKWFSDLKYPIDILDYNNNKNLTMKTIYPLKNITIPNVVEIISENTKERTIKDKEQIKPYYLVIDEINRGNVSKIFGELITLIEDDKRGKLKTYLPYSKKEFTVPNNVYIIGTMNTADRSIATIDTALRRRFTFVEVEPDSNVLSSNNNNPIINDHVNLQKLMDNLNERITERFDRDHRIGHAYFMNIESLEDLYNTWYYKILPLLNEYFYNDIESLNYIVGNKFFDKKGNIQFLDYKNTIDDISEFETQLIVFYEDYNGDE